MAQKSDRFVAAAVGVQRPALGVQRPALAVLGGREMLIACVPGIEELWFRRLMLSDEETMSYNHAWGGTIDFPEERWREWYERWVTHAGSARYYRYLRDETGRFVGEMAYHFDDEAGGYMADVIIFAEYRGRGYGGEALDMLCAAAKANGIATLYDDIAIDNPAVSLFLKHGFSEAYRTETIIMLKKEL